jgi:hypothetical protein
MSGTNGAVGMTDSVEEGELTISPGCAESIGQFFLG